MKNFIAINGSPRRNGNTSTLLQHAIQGAQSAGAKTELVHLYSLNFKGCTSCFACKLKSRPHGTCAMKDDLSPVLERIKEADAVIFGSPIYFMNISAGMAAFIERLFFSNYIYSDEFIFPKKLPSAYFYTMNMTKIIHVMRVLFSIPTKSLLIAKNNSPSTAKRLTTSGAN